MIPFYFEIDFPENLARSKFKPAQGKPDTTGEGGADARTEPK